MYRPRLKPIDYEQARLRMADLCSRSEQCESDIMDKLIRYGQPRVDAERIIAFLYEHGFLNEERYVRAFVNDKIRFNHWGLRKIALALSMKKIPGELISRIVGEIDYDEYIRIAERVCEVKSRKYDLGKYEDRVKLFRSMASCGFSSDEIVKVIDKVRKKQGNEEVD